MCQSLPYGSLLTMIGRLHHIVLDCPEPAALARFYSELLGWPITWQQPDWVVVAADQRSSGLAFQPVADYRAPDWPDPAYPQQLHLDVMVDDPDEAEPLVLALGARRLRAPDPAAADPAAADPAAADPAAADSAAADSGSRVYADPAGHPFCLIPRPAWAPPVGALRSRPLMFRIAFLEPKIPPNTGNAIRLVAATGSELHLVGPLGFDLSDAKLRRAGLDYHDLASVVVHHDLDAAWAAWEASAAREAPVGSADASSAGPRVYAFTTRAATRFTEVRYQPGDVLLFGTEPTGLPAEVLADRRISAEVRIPMLAGRRSLNLSNAAAVAAYEAWRQHGFAGA
jgi:tRNA (cytidine/uridine-2'-O-)-methyltransferase